MGLTKKWIMEEQERELEAFRAMPDALADAHASIEGLQAELASVNSKQSQYKNHLIGGLIGAVISLFFVGLINLL